ncbi:hypothetical protein Desor_2444 [Desulfosporosinus orientis DSM 765]|uniref:Uncharacterized protein n=1 Tax=Desulfosporosinus orientis (strain ATCC 19365 / DSM 765 / NCIMB 8382 / VKM B-1628 / Singapore I) TaxID=768706 RepID=G7WFC9_DESOD|nr:hypothetical protein [Desulfosporosinus orientis]AET68015.1 hypothetical protein Desor_2444 [Desulfosporosinus orientis DSM 765]
METQTIEELIYNETKRRLELMEQADYEFPKTIGKGDVLAIIVSITVCILLIALCMIGVIQ